MLIAIDIKSYQGDTFFVGNLKGIALSLGLGLGLSVSTGSAQTFTIASGNLNHNQKIISKVSELYTRMGFEIEIIRLPLKRSIKDTNQGAYDAELARIANLSYEFTNLVRVPEPIHVLDACAVLPTNADYTVEKWSDLGRLTHARQNGVVLFETRTQDYSGFPIENPETIPKMVSIGRADVGIMLCEDARSAVRDMKDITVLSEPPLETITLYHYVHKKHENLVGTMAQHLRDIKAEQIN